MLCQPAREKGSPITYAATTPLFTHTHTLHDSWLIFNHAPICHGEKMEEVDREAKKRERRWKRGEELEHKNKGRESEEMEM